MALISCPECGKEISDKSISCPNCGYIISDNRNQKNHIRNLVIAISIFCALIIVITIAIFGTQNFRMYKKAQKSLKNKDYISAIAEFKKLGDYKNSKSLSKKAYHMEKVEKDTIPPTISASSYNASVELGTELNFEEWLKEESGIIVKDSVSDELDYDISGDYDTNVAGNYTITVSAKDEAGNTGNTEFTITVYKPLSQSWKSYDSAQLLYKTETFFESDGQGNYYKDGIKVFSEDVAQFSIAGDKLKPGSMYRGAAESLQNFYALENNESEYQYWTQNNIAPIFGLDTSTSWNDLKPYIDNTTVFINNSIGKVDLMKTLANFNVATYNFDESTNEHHFTVNNMIEASNTLKITEKMFGFIIAFLGESAYQIEFEDSDTVSNVKCDIIIKEGTSNNTTNENSNINGNSSGHIVSGGGRFY